MLKIFLFSGVLLTSSFAILSSAQAMDVLDERSYTTSIGQLKKAYKTKLFVEGEESSMTVSNLSETEPLFDECNLDEKLTAYSQNNFFQFLKEEPSRREKKTGDQFDTYIPSKLLFNVVAKVEPVCICEFVLDDSWKIQTAAYLPSKEKFFEIQRASIVKTNIGKFAVSTWGVFNVPNASNLHDFGDGKVYFVSYGKDPSLHFSQQSPIEHDENGFKTYDSYRLTLTRLDN